MIKKIHFTTSDKVEILRSTDLFGNLAEDQLLKIAALAATRSLEPNQVLYSESEEALALFVVARGELRSIRQNIDGREQVLSTERAGAVLATAPIFNGGKFYSTMIADTRAEVLSIEKHHLHQLCRAHTEILWNLARLLAHTVRHYAELIESLALRNVEQRVAQHLLTIARERGVSSGDGSIFELTLTRTQMASRLGSAREVVSRALTHLQKCGLIHMSGRRLVTVPNMHLLSAFAGSEGPELVPQLMSDLSSEIA
jgi:CRP/FNR family transcriptional regulator, cyclic AMP receptor protein